MPAKTLFLTIEMRRLYRPVRGQARSYAFGRSGSGKASAADLNEQILMRGYSRERTWIWRPREPVGARLPANALVRTIEIRRLHPPLRGQARSYAFGRSGFGAASAADLNQQISMRGYSRGQTWMWHPPQTL